MAARGAGSARKEHARHVARNADARAWLDEVTASIANWH